MGSAQTRKFFEKNLTKNFHTWDSANIGCSTVERRYYNKKYAPTFQSFWKMGVRGKKSFFPKSFLPPPKTSKHIINI